MLEQALPAGIPRGRLTEVTGPAGSGKTSLLRHVVARAVGDGLGVAYVDATRTLAPRDWSFASTESLWMVRPPAAIHAAWCADVLLRSGAFALVVLDGAPPITRAVAVRLTRLARESNAALVVMGEEGAAATQLGGALRLRLSAVAARIRWRDQRSRSRDAGDRWRRPGAPADPFPEQLSPGRRREQQPTRRFVVTVEKGGSHQSVEVGCAIGVARRLCTYPEVPDRRGVAASRRGRERSGAGDASTGGAALASAPAFAPEPRPTLARKQRCAEPPTAFAAAGDAFLGALG